MIAATARFLLAALAGTAGVIIAICAITGRWPAVVTVRNDVEPVTCALAFSDGWTWNVDLAEDQKKFWIFLLGKPDSVDVACKAPTDTIAFRRYFCGPGSDFLLAISRKPAIGECDVPA